MASRLRWDDEDLVDDIRAWTGRVDGPSEIAVAAFTDPHHLDAVADRLRDEGWETLRRNELTHPLHQDRLMLLTDRQAQHGRGRRLDRVFIHPDCSERVRQALLPCLLA